jgi:hypothetical protein
MELFSGSDLILSNALIVSLETVQREGLQTFFRAAPVKVAEKFGIRVQQHGAKSYYATRDLPGFRFNRILGFGIDGPVTPECLDVAVDWLRHYCPPGSPLMLPPLDASPHLPAWLEECGLRRHDIDVAVFHLPEGALCEPPKQSGVQVRKVSPAEAGTFGQVICGGPGQPIEVAAWLAALVGQTGVTAYLAYEGETAIGGAALFVSGARARLFFAFTLPEFRRCGAQSALLAQRVADGRAAGATVFCVETLVPAQGSSVRTCDRCRAFSMREGPSEET